MKILIVIEHANFGGHVQSALTTARTLKARGYEVIVASGPGVLVPTIEEEFRYFHVPFHFNHSGRQTYFALKSRETVSQIAEIVSEGSIEMIHAFDARSYIASTLVSLFNISTPVTGTLCGGVTPYYNIPLAGQFIVFSSEQKNKMINQFGWKNSAVCVCSARVDMEQFSISDDEIKTLCLDYHISVPGKYIMMITTFLDIKEKSIRNTLEAMREVLRQHKEYKFVLIGGKGEFFCSAKKIGMEINKELGRPAIIFTGLIPAAFRMLKVATIVIGLGRSAFEGMAFEKPTLIVGDAGYAGTVCRDNIEDLALYNFSGRNQKSPVTADVLSNEINQLIDDKLYYDEIKSFGKSFLMNNISIESGIETIEKVYQVNTEFNQKKSRQRRIINLFRVLSPILFDNYYNQVKKFIRHGG